MGLFYYFSFVRCPLNIMAVFLIPLPITFYIIIRVPFSTLLPAAERTHFQYIRLHLIDFTLFAKESAKREMKKIETLFPPSIIFFKGFIYLIRAP